VLPFQEVGAKSDDLLADGITEALIGDLARASGLKVISRSSVMRFRDSVEPLEEIARRLGVDALVTGSVRRSGNRIRISVELIEAASERVLWADRYDRELEDVLRLQDEMAHAIADGVQARVRQDDDERSTPMPRQVSPEVYMLDLKGRQQIELRTVASYQAALAYFRKALGLDPSYGPCWLGIVRTYNMQVSYGMAAPAQVRAEMEDALARAREFGADPAEVLGELAQMRWQLDFDWDAADAEFRRGLELAPNNSRLWYWRGIMLATGGVFATAFECLDRAQSLDPLSDFMRAARGLLLYFANRIPESVATLREVVELSPDHASTYWLQCMALAAAGRYDEAAASGEIAVVRIGRIARALGYVAYSLARAGREAEARRLLAEMQEQRSQGHVSPYFPAMVLLALDEREAALAQLEYGRAAGDSMLRDMRVDRVWDALREEPRFKAIEASMRFPGHSTAETRLLDLGSASQ
jgi:TolB-like protein/Flp pilus assembly protein TadD